MSGLTPEQEALLIQCLPFVRHIAGKLAGRLPVTVDIDDLDAAGRVGLLQAVQSFDPGMEISPLTFLKYRIRGAMLDEIRSMDWIGRTYRSKGTNLPKMTSFSHIMGEGDELGLVLDPASDWVTPERKAEARETVSWFLDRLSKRDARIVWAYLGPDSMTFREIGEELGISEGRVSNLYWKAVERMRALLEKFGNDPI